MKTRNIFISALVMTMGLVGCTSDNEDYSSQDDQLKEFKARYYALAEEYGVEGNISKDDNDLKSKMNWSDEQIEKEMKFIASIKGTYYGVKEGKTFRLMKKNRTRSFDEEHEAWEGSVSGTFSGIDIGFDFRYDPFGGLDFVRLTEFTYMTPDDIYTITDFTVSQVQYNFVGENSFVYTAQVYGKGIGCWSLMATCIGEDLAVDLQ